MYETTLKKALCITQAAQELELSSSLDEKNAQTNYQENGLYRKYMTQAKLLDDLSQRNFTNRLLASTCHFVKLAMSYKTSHYIRDYGSQIEEELSQNPQKASGRLATLATVNYMHDGDIRLLTDGVKPGTTKSELAEFFTTRENWSTGLRMIDYLNAHTVMSMTRYLPEKDRLDLWNIKPELVNDVFVGSSLVQLSPNSQEAILNTVHDPVRKASIRKEIDAPITDPVHFSTLFDGGYLNPKTVEIIARFSDIRSRRICSHEDNRRFFPTQERFRSSY